MHGSVSMHSHSDSSQQLNKHVAALCHLELRTKGHRSMPEAGSRSSVLACNAAPSEGIQIQSPHSIEGLSWADATSKDYQSIAEQHC